MSSLHVPILLEPIIQFLTEPFLNLPPDAPSHCMMDCTLGGGGHTEAFLKFFQSHPALRKHKVLSIDQDPEAVSQAKSRFIKELGEGRLEIVQGRFGQLASLVQANRVLGLLADLGFSSDQLEDSKRGLSFQKDSPLDMRLDPTEGLSCLQLLERVDQKDLEKILFEGSEERFARRIAQAIIHKRERNELPQTTGQLVSVIVSALPSFARHGRIHAATRTFQALRIAVNDELGELDRLLKDVIINVMHGGRIAVMSFHSLEDRKVKNCFKDKNFFRILTKKPVQASEKEQAENPRSRSAKLRIAERQ